MERIPIVYRNSLIAKRCLFAMPSRINLLFRRLSGSKRQVGYVLLTRAPVAIGSIATSMLPLDLHVLSL